ncbi:MAG TPA: hypothetical protein VNC84_03170 [Gammaproteobacteria bacterium]|jgi:hypothetical protein|nr:hypothetical protein [Gammaproteobacteria bacterium]
MQRQPKNPDEKAPLLGHSEEIVLDRKSVDEKLENLRRRVDKISTILPEEREKFRALKESITTNTALFGETWEIIHSVFTLEENADSVHTQAREDLIKLEKTFTDVINKISTHLASLEEVCDASAQVDATKQRMLFVNFILKALKDGSAGALTAAAEIAKQEQNRLAETEALVAAVETARRATILSSREKAIQLFNSQIQTKQEELKAKQEEHNRATDLYIKMNLRLFESQEKLIKDNLRNVNKDKQHYQQRLTEHILKEIYVALRAERQKVKDADPYADHNEMLINYYVKKAIPNSQNSDVKLWYKNDSTKWIIDNMLQVLSLEEEAKQASDAVVKLHGELAELQTQREKLDSWDEATIFAQKETAIQAAAAVLESYGESLQANLSINLEEHQKAHGHFEKTYTDLTKSESNLASVAKNIKGSGSYKAKVGLGVLACLGAAGAVAGILLAPPLGIAAAIGIAVADEAILGLIVGSSLFGVVNAVLAKKVGNGTDASQKLVNATKKLAGETHKTTHMMTGLEAGLFSKTKKTCFYQIHVTLPHGRGSVTVPISKTQSAQEAD